MGKHTPNDTLDKILGDWFGGQWIDLDQLNKSRFLEELGKALQVEEVTNG